MRNVPLAKLCQLHVCKILFSCRKVSKIRAFLDKEQPGCLERGLPGRGNLQPIQEEVDEVGEEVEEELEKESSGHPFLNECLAFLQDVEKGNAPNHKWVSRSLAKEVQTAVQSYMDSTKVCRGVGDAARELQEGLSTLPARVCFLV